MKKVVRILGLCALVALAFTSCKKDKQNEELKFMASITQPVNTSKTHIDNATNMLVWDANNTIKVFNANGVEGDFTTTDNDVVEATFVGTLPETSTYTAFYPNAAVNGSAVTLSLNANQTYVANNFGNDTYPMAANSTLSSGNYHFNFHSPACVVRLQLKSDHNCTVKSITMTGTANDKLAGDIVYANFNEPSTCTLENGVNTVTLTAAEGVQLAAEQVTAFNIVVMNGTMSTGTKFEVRDMNDRVIKTLTTTRPNPLDAEYILIMPLMEVSYEYPDVTTTAATAVTYQTATINGTYTFPAGAPVNACGFYWGTDQTAVANGTATKVNATVETPMHYDLSSLSANTTYYFKAWAANETGESCGAVLSFTTPVQIVAPRVQTIGHNITGTSATLNGKLVSDGNEACTVGIQFSTNSNMSGAQNLAVNGTHNSVYDFSKNKGGLSFNVTYYYRAYATNSNSTVYGEIMSLRISWVGHFLVDDTPGDFKFVRFSTGLLYWDNDAQEFAFENDQWSFHRWMDAESEVEPNASYSQFCWSNEFNDYGKNNTPNQTGHGFVDWGNNVIRKSNSTDYDPANTWRTLTYPEWECIIRNHDHIVRDVNGMNYFILLPYEMTASQASGYSNQQLSDLGAAYFPMCGNAVDDPGQNPMSWGYNSQICIWSASVATDSGNWGQAGAVWFYADGGGYINAGGMHNTYYHRMQVRLAQDEN